MGTRFMGTIKSMKVHRKRQIVVSGGQQAVMKQKLGVLGGGYVGLAVAVGFAERGHPVVLVESSEARLNALTKGSFFSSEEEFVHAFAEVKHKNLLRITNRLDEIQDITYLFYV